MAATARPIPRWRLAPPFPFAEVFADPLLPDLIFRTLRLDAESPERGRALFTGSLAQRTQLWREYKNYIRQGFAYFEGAKGTGGSAAGLLYYYSALNFAKAELLKANPAAVLGVNVRHGLSFRPSDGKSVATDKLTVTPGVFPLLYEKRTGQSLPVGSKLPVRRLLWNVPEMGWEVTNLNLGQCMTGGFIHVIAMNDTDAWSVIATQRADLLLGAGVTQRLFGRHYELVNPIPSWRDIIGVTGRWISDNHFLFQSKATWPVNQPGQLVTDVYTSLRPILDEPVGPRL